MINKHQDDSKKYLIVVDGILDSRWQAWFEELSIRVQPDGSTHLEGELHDQAELHGVLKRINNLGLKLISVNPLGS